MRQRSLIDGDTRAMPATIGSLVRVYGVTYTTAKEEAGDSCAGCALEDECPEDFECLVSTRRILKPLTSQLFSGGPTSDKER